MSKWFVHTADTDRKIIEGYQDGQAILVIADSIGATRNVVIGRARVLGLCNQGNLDRARRKEEVRAKHSANRTSWWKDPNKSASHQHVISSMHRGRDEYYLSKASQPQKGEK